MAFCGKCGSEVNEGTAFCPRCGTAVAAAPTGQPYSTPYAPPPPQGQPYGTPYAPPPPPPGQPPYAPYPPPPAAASGLQENVAGMLAYSLGWLTGIVFLLIDKRPFVRFHAAQSIVTFGILHVLQIVLAFVWVGTSYYGGGWGIHWMVSSLISLVTFVAWIFLMVMAYQGKRFAVPVASSIAESLAGKV